MISLDGGIWVSEQLIVDNQSKTSGKKDEGGFESSAYVQGFPPQNPTGRVGTGVGSSSFFASKGDARSRQGLGSDYWREKMQLTSGTTHALTEDQGGHFVFLGARFEEMSELSFGDFLFSRAHDHDILSWIFILRDVRRGSPNGWKR